MGIKEKDLPSASGVSGTDYMREVTSGGLSYKALVADVAKYIVENYNGSSLAGSSQSVKSAVDSLNSKLGTNLGNNPNFDNATDTGFYYFGSTASATNPPSTYGYLNMIVLKINSTYISQIVFGGRQATTPAACKIWVRYRSSGTWGAWVSFSAD